MEKLRKKDEEEENARNLLRDQAAQVSLEAVYCRMQIHFSNTMSI